MQYIRLQMIVVLCLALLHAKPVNGQTTGDLRSAGAGPANTNASTSWERYSSLGVWEASGVGENNPGQVPSAATAVTVRAGHTITFNSSSSYKSLLVEGTLSMGSTANTNRTLTVGDVTVSLGGSIVPTPAAVSPNHTISTNGNLTNNGTITAFDVSGGARVKVSCSFTKAGTAILSGSGTTGLSTMTVNNGTSLDLQTDITVGSGATSTGGLVLSGTIQTSNGSSLAYASSTGTLTYSATSAQATSDFEFPPANGPYALTINNAAGVSLHASRTIQGTLTLTNGTLSTGSQTISIGATGAVARTNGYVIGTLSKLAITGSKTFEVGTTAGYTPVVVNGVGTGDFAVKTTLGKHPDRSNENVLGMYWTLTNGGLTSADVTFTYLDTDVNGTESSYDLAHWGGSFWTLQLVGVNTTANTSTVLGVTSFSDWTLGEPPSLPIQLASFTGVVTGASTVRLDWRTVGEINNFGFYVERKRAGESTYSVVPSSFVSGHGTTNVPHDYSFVDDDAGTYAGSYRLRQVDLDGTVHYSDPINPMIPSSVSGDVPARFELFNGYPNPFNPEATIRFSVERIGRTAVTVYSLLGERVASLFDGVAEPGRIYAVTFNAAQLSSGTYLVRLESGGNNATKRILLLR